MSPMSSCLKSAQFQPLFLVPPRRQWMSLRGSPIQRSLAKRFTDVFDGWRWEVCPPYSKKIPNSLITFCDYRCLYKVVLKIVFHGPRSASASSSSSSSSSSSWSSSSSSSSSSSVFLAHFWNAVHLHLLFSVTYCHISSTRNAKNRGTFIRGILARGLGDRIGGTGKQKWSGLFCTQYIHDMNIPYHIIMCIYTNKQSQC